MARFDATPQNPDAEIRSIIEDPTSPTWIVDVAKAALVRDPVDACSALEHLAKAFRRRMSAVFDAHSLASE